MKILVIINWCIKEIKSDEVNNFQPSDYWKKGEKFWFFRYFDKGDETTVIDINNSKFKMYIEHFLHAHIFQSLKAVKLCKKEKFDLIFCHGTDSAIFIGFLKKMFHLKIPPIVVVDISSFHRGDKKGLLLKLCQYASKSFDHIIYHATCQRTYFENFFPRLKDKISFIPFGVDSNYWKNLVANSEDKYKEKIIVCAGKRMRDAQMLVDAFSQIRTDYKLYLLGYRKKDFKGKLYSNVVIIPFLDICEYVKIIINSSFAVLPLFNLNYSFGQMTLLQLFALSKPVVVSNSNSIKDYTNTNGVLVYDSSSLIELRSKVEYYINASSDDLLNAGANNFLYVTKERSEEEMAKSIEKICNMYMKGKK